MFGPFLSRILLRERAVALEISKAFDGVWIHMLIYKLPSFGIPVWLCSLIFLFHRVVGWSYIHISNLLPITSGEPQSSVLSPTLFLLFINSRLSSAFNPAIHMRTNQPFTFLVNFLSHTREMFGLVLVR